MTLENDSKLVVVIMGQNCEKFLPMCLESVKDADAIIYCDGGSQECNLNLLYDKYDFDWESKKFLGRTNRFIIQNEYKQDDPSMNGKQRNFYLNYVKKEFPGWWCLVLDADEVVEDLSKIKEFIQTAKQGLYSVKMRHFHNDLGHEDATVPEHFVLNRLFKISAADSYPEVEHPVLKAKEGFVYGQTTATTIWHLAHINHVFNIKGRYEKNLKHSNMHSKQFLDSWMKAHTFGTYPNKQVDPREIPEVILKHFHIDKDEFYFANRGIELKHSIMVKQWAEHFKPDNVLDLGCGRGPYLYFWKWYCGKSYGVELSQWAVNHAFTSEITQGDITNPNLYELKIKSILRDGEIYDVDRDVITAIDVLEHLDDAQLSKTLDNMSKYGKRFIFSIPFIGDPNLENDKTHKQFRTKDEWKELIRQHGIEVEDAPTDWLFHNQLLVGKKKDNI